MKDCCIKVYTLEKVLKLKKTSDGGTTSFLDEAMKVCLTAAVPKVDLTY